MSTPLFVTGIGTGVGKTIVSALLTQQLKADYWKPVQAGDLEQSDRITVSGLISNPQSILYPETYRFKMAASPHKAAAFEGVNIQSTDFILPPLTTRPLIIEGAGGLMVPLSDSLLMVDLIRQFQAEAVLVVRNYLGCINHTLLSLQLLLTRNIPVKYLVFNGDMDPDSESIIRKQLQEGVQVLQTPEFKELDRESLLRCPNLFKN